MVLRASLEVLEQRLDGVQPGRVLGVEQHVHLHAPRGFQNERVVVQLGVVQQQDDVLGVEGWVAAHSLQHLLNEVFENHRVDSAFNELVRNDAVLRDCRDQADRVVLLALARLAHGQLLC